MEILLKLQAILLKFERVIMLFVGLLLPTLITVGVIFRYILKTDLYAIEEIEVFMAIWFYFMGAAYASYKQDQITADILQAMVKSYKVKKILAIAATGLTVAIGLAFCYWSIDMLAYAWKNKPMTAVWKLPLVGEYAAVGIGLFLMLLYAIRDFVEACRRSPEPDTAGK